MINQVEALRVRLCRLTASKSMLLHSAHSELTFTPLSRQSTHRDHPSVLPVSPAVFLSVSQFADLCGVDNMSPSLISELTASDLHTLSQTFCESLTPRFVRYLRASSLLGLRGAECLALAPPQAAKGLSPAAVQSLFESSTSRRQSSAREEEGRKFLLSWSNLSALPRASASAIPTSVVEKFPESSCISVLAKDERAQEAKAALFAEAENLSEEAVENNKSKSKERRSRREVRSGALQVPPLWLHCAKILSSRSMPETANAPASKKHGAERGGLLRPEGPEIFSPWPIIAAAAASACVVYIYSSRRRNGQKGRDARSQLSLA